MSQIERLRQATDELLVFSYEKFGDYVTGYTDPIERAIWALKVARSHLETQLFYRQKEKDETRAYLDDCVRFWRNERDTCTEHQAIAPFYIDAFQSARATLCGEKLPESGATSEGQDGPHR